MGISRKLRNWRRSVRCAIESRISWLRLPRSLGSLAYGRPCDLILPVPDGSGQGVHPDIMLNPAGRPRFVLAFTPYPFSRDRYENPCILVSSDGLRFREERRGLNPLVPPPPIDHNDDPDLFFLGGRWNVIYLETMRPERQNVVLLESTDRLTWTKRLLYSAELLKPGEPFIVSPAFMAAETGNRLYFVNITDPDHRLEYISLPSGIPTAFAGRLAVPIDLGGLIPWHVDCIRDNARFYLLITTVRTEASGTGPRKEYSLYLARSDDQSRWQLSPRCLLENGYRSSGFIDGDDLFVYYSRQTGQNVWRIGVYRVRLSAFFCQPCAEN